MTLLSADSILWLTVIFALRALRAKLNFTWESLKGAEESLNNIYDFLKTKAIKKFIK